MKRNVMRSNFNIAVNYLQFTQKDEVVFNTYFVYESEQAISWEGLPILCICTRFFMYIHEIFAHMHGFCICIWTIWYQLALILLLVFWFDKCAYIEEYASLNMSCKSFGMCGIIHPMTTVESKRKLKKRRRVQKL